MAAAAAAAAAASVTTWPATASALRELLDMDACHSMKCHGETLESKRCSVGISKADCIQADKLLDQIVELGSFEAAQSILSKLASLIMCKNKRVGHGAKFGPGRLSAWKVTLGSIPSPSVEDEEQEEDTSSEYEPDDDSQTPPSSVSGSDVESSQETCTQQDSQDSTTQTSSSITDSPETTEQAKIVHKFERFSVARSTTYINKNIRRLLLRPLLDTEKFVGGYIYTYTFPESYHDAAPFLKIGFASNVQERMARWERQCQYRPKVLVQQSADHYAKIERLVHAQLVNQRKVEAAGCPVCGIRHNEWFGASSLDASRAVSLWASWMRQMPYDEEGQLKGGKWRARIECLDMSDAACWEELVSAIYVDDDDDDEEEDDLSEEEEDEFQWSTDDESHHSEEEYEIYDSEDEYGDKSGSDDEQ